MRRELTMPKVGDSVDVVVLVSWNVQVGDHVVVGDVIATVETDKVEVDIESTAVGTVTELLADVDDDIPTAAPYIALEE